MTNVISLAAQAAVHFGEEASCRNGDSKGVALFAVLAMQEKEVYGGHNAPPETALTVRIRNAAKCSEGCLGLLSQSTPSSCLRHRSPSSALVLMRGEQAHPLAKTLLSVQSRF